MREAILRCAGEVFSQREYHEVLIDQIALALGIGKGTVYRYFDSKEDLYFATIVQGLDGMHEAVMAVFDLPGTLDQTIERLVRTVLDYFWTRRDFFLLLYRMEPKLEPAERAEWHARREQLMARTADLLTRELPADSPARRHTRTTVELLLGMIRTLCLTHADTDTVDGLARVVTDVFLRGAGTAAPASHQTRRSMAAAHRSTRGGLHTP